MIASFIPLYVNVAFRTHLSIALAIMHLLGPVFQHFIAFLELITRYAIVVRRMTLKTPNQQALIALHFSKRRVVVVGGRHFFASFLSAFSYTWIIRLATTR
jgi:hypothetical protein